MNILKWLKDKAGKMPISLTQAAGLTAVVGAAGFAAMSYLSSPSDTATSFVPPSAYEQPGDVVYISQNGGGGQYESNGEVGSSFKAAPSRSIQLANQQAERANQVRALEDANVQPTYAGEEGAPIDPKAYQLSGADLGLGMGGTGDKQGSGVLDMFSNLQSQISGVGDAIANAQAQANGQGGAGTRAGAPSGAADGASGQTAAQLANASHNWGQGGLTRAGSGNGVSNTFAIQDSGKNAGGKDSAAALAQMGNAMADARAAMANLQQEGTRMRSRANFGNSDGLGADRDAAGQGARARYGNAKGELEWIRKQSAEIAKNNTNAANAGGAPFLASAKISGGLMVDGSNVTTGQGSSSADLNSTARQMKGIEAKLASVQANQDERKLARDELKAWFWRALLAGMAAMVTISLLARSFWGWFAAITMAVSTAAYIWTTAISKITHYNGVCGSDKWTVLGWTLAGILTGGITAALVWGPQIAAFIKGLFTSSAEATTGAGTAGAMEGAAGGGSSVVNGGADASGAFWA